MAFAHSIQPVPDKESFFAFQISVLHGSCELGLGRGFHQTHPHLLFSFDTELDLVLPSSNSSSSSFRGEAAMLPQQSSVDTVFTCGFVFSPLQGFVFVAKNGQVAHIAPWPNNAPAAATASSTNNGNVYAFVGAHSPTKIAYRLKPPFRFEQEWTRTMQQYLARATSQFVDKLLPPQSLSARMQVCDKLCRDFLLHHGYVDTLRALDRDCAGDDNNNADEEEEEVVARSRVCGLVRSGEYAKAINLLQMRWPGVLADVDCKVGLQLLILEFQSLLLHHRNDLAAIDFAQKHIWPYTQQQQQQSTTNNGIADMAKNALMLFAKSGSQRRRVGGGGVGGGGYDDDDEEEEAKEEAMRRDTANGLNRKLLELAGHAPSSSLERLVERCNEEGELRRVAAQLGETTAGNAQQQPYGPRFSLERTLRLLHPQLLPPSPTPLRHQEAPPPPQQWH